MQLTANYFWLAFVPFNKFDHSLIHLVSVSAVILQGEAVGEFDYSSLWFQISPGIVGYFCKGER